MIRVISLLILLAAAGGVGYGVALKAPEPFTPVLLRITTCEPRVTAGYVFITPDKPKEIYVGGMQDLSPADKYQANALKKQGKLRLGTIHFKSRAACPGV